ncbi:hypothetical protein [Streptomyces shaanxiensis]
MPDPQRTVRADKSELCSVGAEVQGVGSATAYRTAVAQVARGDVTDLDPAVPAKSGGYGTPGRIERRSRWAGEDNRRRF